MSLVAPFRLMRRQELDSNVRNALDTMMTHDEHRKNLDEHRETCELVLGLAAGHVRDLDLLSRSMGLLHVNAVNLSQSMGRGLFPQFALLSHSCVNNCRHVAIRKGDNYEIR